MIITKSNKSNKCPKTLQIKRKSMASIKIVLKDDYFSNMTSYHSRNITAIETKKHAMKEG
jgi:hypothetical protein